MYEMPKCECGEELEFDNDTDFCNDGDTIIMVSYGYCPKCGKKYKWSDYYILSHWGELEKDE